MTSVVKYKPATFFRRLMAMFYDSILVAALVFIASAISLFANGGQTAGESSVFVQIIISLWLLSVAFAYYGISWTISGQTLGLRTWQMRVLNEQNEAISWTQALLRFLLAIPSIFLLLGLLRILFNKDKKAWHDVLSASQVVDERKPI